MKKRIQCWLWLIIAAAGCKPPGADTGVVAALPAAAMVENDGTRYTITALRQCRYTENDPFFEKHWNKKFLLLQLKVFCIELKNKKAQSPTGAVLTDSRGNNYEASPAIIAAAQSNKCIAGDDIKAYNAIWNGDIKAGETCTAFVLGFEIPEDAVPEKLYWNNDWKNKQLYFTFTDTNYAINH